MLLEDLGMDLNDNIVLWMQQHWSTLDFQEHISSDRNIQWEDLPGLEKFVVESVLNRKDKLLDNLVAARNIVWLLVEILRLDMRQPLLVLLENFCHHPDQVVASSALVGLQSIKMSPANYRVEDEIVASAKLYIEGRSN